MRTIASLLCFISGSLAAGCGSAGAPPSPSPAASSMSSAAHAGAAPALPAATALPSATPDAPPPVVEAWKAPPVVPPLAAPGPRAYVADSSGLVEVAAPGGSQVVVPGRVAWCNADARGKVVWYVAAGSLFAYDLVDRKARAVVVGEGAEGGPIDVASPPIIAWGDQQLGGESKVDYSVAALLTMKSPPKLSASIGCDGDRVHSCYQSPLNLDAPKLNEELAALKQAIEGRALADPAYVAEVAARGAKGSLWSPLPAQPKPPTKRPKVDRAACDAAPEQCGAMRAIPMSSLWIVTVGNSRGDFYHQSDALWDAATSEYVAVKDGKLERRKEAGDSGELGGLRVSPSGVLSTNGAVFDGKSLYFAPKSDNAVSCGWSSGGWRVSGPRDAVAEPWPRPR